jgi:hypothetical protein
MITTVIEVTGIGLVTVGVALLAGIPVGLIVLGGFALAAAWRLNREGTA